MSARVYLMKRVKDCKDVSIMRREYSLCYNVSARWTVNTDKFTLFVYCNFLVLLSTIVCSQNLIKQNVNIADETLTDYSFLSIGITILNQRIIWKDYIEFVTEFPCILGHTVFIPCSNYCRINFMQLIKTSGLYNNFHFYLKILNL